MTFYEEILIKMAILILDIIANDIAKRNWYEQQIYESGFKPLIGEHAPSREIYSYMKKL